MKKILTLILVLAAVLSVSGIALADEAVTLDIANGSIEITATGYKQGAAAEETSHIGDYVISGTYELGNTAADANSNMIKISAGSTDDINVTLKNLAVKHHGSKNSTQSSNNGMISPLQVLSGTVNLTLVGDNTLIADGKCPGLYIKAGATAVINGTGTLKSLGAHQAAGIGAAADASGISKGAGSVIINSGTVIAEGGNEGTGIGAARSRSMESVMITGGHVTAVAGSGRYAVGSSNNALTTLTITGGTLNLSGPSGAFEATTKNITDGNFIIADTYPTVVGRDIAEIYFAGADEKTLVSIK